MSTNVNVPTNTKIKDADVARKLQFYGIATAFSAGKVPSNEQIDVALNSFLKTNAIATPSNKLSSEGQALIADFRDVVKQAQHLLLTKNQGDLLQDFIWQSQQVDGGNAALPGAPVDKDTAKQHGNEALEGLRTLGTLIISNGQFRKLLNDTTILIRDMAGDAASKAATKVNPSDEQLSQIDKPAEDNTWHDTPDMSSGNIKNQLKDTFNKKAPVTTGDLKDAAGNASENANPEGSRDPRDTAQHAQRDQQQGTSSGVDAQGGVQAGIDTLRSRADGDVTEETKEQARLRKERTRKYLASKMPEERREQTIWRLRKMVVEIQGHPDYQQAINTLLNLAETYAGHANSVAQQGTGTVKGAHADTSLKRAENDLKILIERFANGTSTDDLFDSINTIYKDADRDPELKSWFKSLDKYIRKCLKQQGYIMEDSATDEWNQLYDRGNFLLRERYRNHTDRIADEVKFLAGEFEKDPLNKRFGDSMQKLFNDLGNDEDGKPTFKPHLIKDLTEVILPNIFESIRYVPIPRVEYTDPMMDVVVENLVIESDNLMPNVFEFASDNYWRFGRKQIANKNQNSVMLSISGVQMDLRDVNFYINKKQGTPKIKDQGVADIFLGGTGLSFKIKMSTADKKDQQNFFKIDKVDVDVKNFNIKLKKSKYKLLFKLAKPVMLKVMRPALQKVIEKLIKEKFHELDSMAYEIKQEVDRAQKEVIDNPEDAPNIYNRYVTAAQKKIMQGKQKAEKVQAQAANTKVNMAITKDDSIFPGVHLDNGISTKATEYKQLALKGEEWRSPIFSLGSASTSTDLAAAPEVTRKDHPVAGGGVKGPQNIGNTESLSNQLHDPAAQQNGQSTGGHTNGFANGAAAGVGGTPSAGAGVGGATNGNAQFGNQVDQAFSEKTGATQLPGHIHTQLGSNNPVLTGSA